MTYDELNGLKFLHAVVKETLRLYVKTPRRFCCSFHMLGLVGILLLSNWSARKLLVVLKALSPSLVSPLSAAQDVTVPLHTPVKGTDGQMISHIHIAKNQNVIIGIANCNRDTRIWGNDAMEWKPERWLGPLPESLVEAHIPGVFPNV
jgi:hypothetical protein